MGNRPTYRKRTSNRPTYRKRTTNRPTYRKRTTKKVYKNCQKLQTFITGFKTKKFSQWEHEHILMSWTKWEVGLRIECLWMPPDDNVVIRGFIIYFKRLNAKC